MQQSQKDSETDSVSTSTIPDVPKKDWIRKWIQKMSQLLQTEENKKMIQIFLVDPILNHVLERVFPYVLILCVLFVILTIMISMILLIVFTRIPSVFRDISIINES